MYSKTDSTGLVQQLITHPPEIPEHTGLSGPSTQPLSDSQRNRIVVRGIDFAFLKSINLTSILSELRRPFSRTTATTEREPIESTSN